MFDWLSGIIGDITGSGDSGSWISSLFGAAGAAVGNGGQSSNGMMSRQPSVYGPNPIGPGREYGNQSPQASPTKAAPTANADQIAYMWERRMYRLMTQTTNQAL